MEFSHVSVLYEEAIDNLNIRPDGVYVERDVGRRRPCGRNLRKAE